MWTGITTLYNSHDVIYVYLPYIYIMNNCRLNVKKSTNARQIIEWVCANSMDVGIVQFRFDFLDQEICFFFLYFILLKYYFIFLNVRMYTACLMAR